MIVEDTIYGQFEVDEILGQLINSKPVQRLKYIHQGGANHLVNKEWNNTRFEHSIGVMYITRQLGGILEEQIAGLLHDVSHTAFSHVVDSVFDNTNEDYHEQIYLQVVENSEIPKILSQHQLDYKSILIDLHKWNILEKDLPDLCADRIDYTLRDLFQIGKITKNEIIKFLDSLTLQNGNIVIKSLEMAEWFVESYYNLIFDYFQNPKNIMACEYLSKALKLAIEKGILLEDDLRKTDDEVMDILNKSQNSELKELINKISLANVEDNECGYCLHVKRKIRIIDPLISVNGKLERSTEYSEFIKCQNEEALRKSKRGVYLKII